MLSMMKETIFADSKPVESSKDFYNGPAKSWQQFWPLLGDIPTVSMWVGL